MTFLVQNIINNKTKQSCSLPDAGAAKTFIKDLYELLYICKGRENNQEDLVELQLKSLKHTLKTLIRSVIQDDIKSGQEAEEFFDNVPFIYEKCLLDAQAIYEADPAAKNLDEVFIAYPGFYAIFVHRIAHQLYEQKIDLLPRLFSEDAHSKTGIDIHPGAKIGNHFSIDHGTGIVIGETTVIGNHVKVFQGVTLGALIVIKEKASQKRHPTIEDNVVIYSGATILGGETVIGHDSVIGGNVWLTHSVVPFSVVFQQSETIIQDKKSFQKPLDWVI